MTRVKEINDDIHNQFVPNPILPTVPSEGR